MKNSLICSLCLVGTILTGCSNATNTDTNKKENSIEIAEIQNKLTETNKKLAELQSQGKNSGVYSPEIFLKASKVESNSGESAALILHVLDIHLDPNVAVVYKKLGSGDLSPILQKWPGKINGGSDKQIYGYVIKINFVEPVTRELSNSSGDKIKVTSNEIYLHLPVGDKATHLYFKDGEKHEYQHFVTDLDYMKPPKTQNTYNSEVFVKELLEFDVKRGNFWFNG